MNRPSICPLCRAPFFTADPRWKFHLVTRTWRHNCAMGVQPVNREFQITLWSRRGKVVCDLNAPTAQFSLDPGSTLEFARTMIQNAARAGEWNDCISDLPNLVRQMRLMQQSHDGPRGTSSPDPDRAAASKLLETVEAAVDQWLDRFDPGPRPALPKLQDGEAQAVPEAEGPPS